MDDTQPVPVTVVRNRKVRAAGRRLGEAIVYDWGFPYRGVRYEQRSFILLPDGIQINQPVIFPPERRGWWYCDLVRVADHGDLVEVDDYWIDVIVGPPDHPYRILDLEEFGAAVASGEMTVTEAADSLARFQRFLDGHLNRRHGVDNSTWPDFPPRAVEPLRELTFPREWSSADWSHRDP